MKSLPAAVLATSVACAALALATHALAAGKDGGARKHSRSTVIRARRPTVVVFAPESWATDAKTDEGTNELVAHVSFAVGDVERCMGETPIDVRLAFADRLEFDIAGHHDEIDLATKFPDSAGAVLLKPGKKACTITTPGDTAFLGDLLSQAVGKFFAVPTCLQWEASDDPCRAGGRVCFDRPEDGGFMNLQAVRLLARRDGRSREVARLRGGESTCIELDLGQWSLQARSTLPYDPSASDPDACRSRPLRVRMDHKDVRVTVSPQSKGSEYLCGWDLR